MPQEGASESAFDFRAGLRGAEPLLQHEASERNPLDEFPTALTPGSSQLRLKQQPEACIGSDVQNSFPGGGLERQSHGRGEGARISRLTEGTLHQVASENGPQLEAEDLDLSPAFGRGPASGMQTGLQTLRMSMSKENGRGNLGQKVVYLGAPVVVDVSRSYFTSDLNVSTPLTTPGPDTLPVVGKLGKPSLRVAAQRHKGLEVKELRLQKGSFPDSI